MQCFICVTYMMVLCSANPTKPRAIAATHEERSLFKDVIASLRIRSHLPEDISPNDENNLSQNYDRYGYEDEPSTLLSGSDFIPRRNDRIEMPSIKYRLPKNIDLNSDGNIQTKEAVVLYIDTNLSKLTTQKPKNSKIRRPSVNKVKISNKVKENEENSTDPDDNFPFSNTMSGQSQIGNRDSQTVLKPTVIVNIRGSVNHRDSDIRLESREQERMNNNSSAPIQNIFNINQEVKIVKETTDNRRKKPVQQEIKAVIGKDQKVEEDKLEENLMMCETATWKSEKAEENRKYDNAFQILLSI